MNLSPSTKTKLCRRFATTFFATCVSNITWDILDVSVSSLQKISKTYISYHIMLYVWYWFVYWLTDIHVLFLRPKHSYVLGFRSTMVLRRPRDVDLEPLLDLWPQWIDRDLSGVPSSAVMSSLGSMGSEWMLNVLLTGLELCLEEDPTNQENRLSGRGALASEYSNRFGNQIVRWMNP